ncbi:hypothetical protein [Nocardia sp. NPDC051750]|uniref:hypothetical protein n=1 Tax=Nocardia sp. NPDC051750 TaxID=3364325 RepID=UPI00379921C5
MVTVTSHLLACEFGEFPDSRAFRWYFAPGSAAFSFYDLRPGSAWSSPAGDGWVVFSWRRQTQLPYSSLEIPATEGEIAQWSQARETAVAALRAAEAQLVHDRGLRIVTEPDGRSGLRRESGWRAARRRRDRSGLRRSIDEFGARLRQIDDEYEPVRVVIADRVRAVLEIRRRESREAMREFEQRRREETEQRLRELEEQQREAEQQRALQEERIRTVAADAVWSYRVDEPGRAVHVFHTGDSSLDTCTLADRLRETHRINGYAVHWNDADRAEVERRSGVDFDTWWRTVIPGYWSDPHRIPYSPRPGRHTSIHTSFGVGGPTDTGSGGFAGTHGCGGGF